MGLLFDTTYLQAVCGAVCFSGCTYVFYSLVRSGVSILWKSVLLCAVWCDEWWIVFGLKENPGPIFLFLIFGSKILLGTLNDQSVHYWVRTLKPANANWLYNGTIWGKHLRQNKLLVFTTGRLINVTIRVWQHGKDPYRDTPVSDYLNNCKETVENYGLYSQWFTSFRSEVAPHSVAV